MYRLTVKIIFFASLLLFLLLTACFLFTLNSFYFKVAALSAFSSLFFLGILMPPTCKERAKTKDPSMPLGCEKCDVWVYVSEEGFYLPWYNAVAKEIGPCSLVERISTNSRPRLLIMPLGSRISEAEIEIVSKWVFEGSSILFESPDDSFADLTGLFNTGEKYYCSIEEFMSASVDMKGAVCRFYKIFNMKKKEEDSKPCLWFEKKIGKGFVFSLAVEYGRWVKDISQGKPNRPNGRYSKRLDSNIQGIQTPDLRTDKPEPYAFTPVLDIFDGELFGYIRDKLRIPGWWYYPDNKKCAFVLTFDEDWYGKKIKKFPSPGVPATWFVVDDSDIDIDAIEFIGREEGDIQFHWNRFLIHLNKFGWHLCIRKIAEQVKILHEKIKKRPFICRIHYLRWDSDFDNLFYVMKNTGISIDSSFGPGRGQHGYRFGTGFPYFVCDRNGRPIGIQEIPFQIHEPMGGAPIDDHVKLLTESVNNYHTTIVGLFHPYYCLPGGRSNGSYEKILNLVNDEAIWATNLEGISRFWGKRRETAIITHFEGHTLFITVTGIREKMTLRIPDDKNISGIVLNGSSKNLDPKLILGPGKHIISISYRN